MRLITPRFAAATTCEYNKVDEETWKDKKKKGRKDVKKYVPGD